MLRGSKLPWFTVEQAAFCSFVWRHEKESTVRNPASLAAGLPHKTIVTKEGLDGYHFSRALCSLSKILFIPQESYQGKRVCCCSLLGAGLFLPLSEHGIFTSWPQPRVLSSALGRKSNFSHWQQNCSLAPSAFATEETSQLGNC